MTGYAPTWGSWWELKTYEGMRKEVFGFLPNPSIMLPILLPGKNNSSWKVSASQGYLVPANAKLSPQQTGVEQQLFSANTLCSVTIALYARERIHPRGHLSNSGDDGGGGNDINPKEHLRTFSARRPNDIISQNSLSRK